MNTRQRQPAKLPLPVHMPFSGVLIATELRRPNSALAGITEAGGPEARALTGIAEAGGSEARTLARVARTGGSEALALRMQRTGASGIRTGNTDEYDCAHQHGRLDNPPKRGERPQGAGVGVEFRHYQLPWFGRGPIDHGRWSAARSKERIALATRIVKRFSLYVNTKRTEILY